MYFVNKLEHRHTWLPIILNIAKAIFTIFVLIFFSPNDLLSQMTNCSDSLFAKTYNNGIDSTLLGYDMILTDSNSLIGCGVMRNTSLGTFDDAFIAKWDNNGGILWQKTYSENSGQAMHRVAKLHDNKFIVLGSDGKTGNSQYLLIKFDNSGNIIWKKTLEIPNNIISNIAGILENDSNQIIITAYFLENTLSFQDRGFFIKLDSSGNVLLSKIIDPPTSIGVFVPQSFTIIDNYSYVCGYHFSPYSKGLLVKIDNRNGDVVWGKVYNFNGRSADFARIFKYDSTRLCILGATSYNLVDTSLIFIIDTSGTVELSKSILYKSAGYNRTPTATLDKYGNLLWANYISGLTIMSVNPYIGINWAKKYGTVLSYANEIQIGTDSDIYTIGNKTLGNYGNEILLNRLSHLGVAMCPSVPFTTTLTNGNSLSNTIKIATRNLTLLTPTTQYNVFTNRIFPGSDLCAPIICNALSIRGQDTVCGFLDSIRFSFIKNPGCTLFPDILYDTTKLTYISGTDSSSIFVSRSTGLANIKVRIINSCDTLLDSIQINVFNSPILNLGPDTSICPSNSLILNAHSGFTSYQWNTGSTDSSITVTTPGKYYVTVTNGCGNVFSDTINIFPASQIPFSGGADRSKCNNDTIQLHAPSGFLNYSWSPNYNISSTTIKDVVVNPAVDTTYFVKAEKTPGCFAYDTVKVLIHTSTPIFLGGDSTLCLGDSIVLNVGSGFTNYIWNTGAISPLIVAHISDNYSVIAINANGCMSMDTIKIRFDSIPVFSLGKDTALCETQTLLLQTAVSGNYLWQNGSSANQQIATTVGTYWLQVSRGSCKYRDSIEVKIDSMPIVHLPTDTILCNQAILLLDVKQRDTISTYRWQDGSTGNQYLVKQPGTYIATVTKNNCLRSDTCIVAFQNSPKINLGNDTTKCKDDILQFNATFPYAKYMWQDNSNLAVYHVATAGTYYCLVTNFCGNIADTIKVKDEVCECDVTIPNAFSPNGDGKNDYFKPIVNCTPSQFSLSIYTRYGTLIAESFNFTKGWDGLYHGQRVPVGVYYYVLNIQGAFSNKKRQYSGVVTVL